MHQVYSEHFDSPNRCISHSALTQFLGEWENVLSVLMVWENMPMCCPHVTRRIMGFIFQGILPKHWINLIWKNHYKFCKDVVQVGQLRLLVIKSVIWQGFLLWMFLTRLYGDLWFSQIPSLNLRKGICETNSYSHLWESDTMAQSLGYCRGSMTISSPFYHVQNGEVSQPFD